MTSVDGDPFVVGDEFDGAFEYFGGGFVGGVGEEGHDEGEVFHGEVDGHGGEFGGEWEGGGGCG